MIESSEPEGFIETVARFYGQVSINMQQMDKAVNEIDGKQNATSHLTESLVTQIQGLQSQMQKRPATEDYS